MRQIRGWSEIDRLDVAVKWERIRAAYFESYGQLELSKSLTNKSGQLKRELDFLQHGKGCFFNSAKPDAFQLNESTGLWTDGDSVFCDAIICL